MDTITGEMTDHHDKNIPEKRAVSQDSVIKWPNDDITCHSTAPSPGRKNYDMIYQVHDNPPWYLAIVFGFQHYLLTISGIALPLIVLTNMCAGDDDVGKSEVMSTSFFVEGLVTFLQATFGTRLPIVQGSSIAYFIPTLAILGLPEWKCPDEPVGLNGTELFDWRREVWTTRMREIQGAITVVGVIQVVIGLSGIIGLLLRYISPICIAAFLTLLGLSPFLTAAKYGSKQWGIAFMVLVLITLFSQYLRNVNVPFMGYKRGQGCVKVRYPLFKLIPVIGAVVITWLFCFVLTVTNVWPDDPSQGYGYEARTDLKLGALRGASWFRFPYPGQWGLPTVSIAAVLGMLTGALAGILESIGDYNACAQLSGAPPVPDHAVNRGIMVEGLGIMLSGLWGSGIGLTSFSGNIGAIGITKVGSRRVIQWCGIIIIILGLLGKFGAIFVGIPEPILGGILLSVFGIITAVGVSTLRFADMTSSRNLFIYGSSVFLGLTVSVWMSNNSDSIKTGSTVVDQILTVILSSGMFIGGVFSFILDNTVSGTVEERGLRRWRSADPSQYGHVTAEDVKAAYGLPYVMTYIERWNWTRLIPVCPTFTGIKCCKNTASNDMNNSKNETLSPAMSATEQTYVQTRL